MMTSRARTLLCLLLPALLVLVLLAPALRVDRLLYGSATLIEYYPWRHFAFSELRQGRFPSWNPYVACGFPCAAEIHHAVFYPGNFLFLFLPTHLALTGTAALHMFGSGLGLFLFLRLLGCGRFGALFGGLCFMWSGYNILHLRAGHHNLFNTTAWIPFVFFMFERWIREPKLKRSVLLGLTLALQFLSGHPQIFYYSGLALGAYFLYRLPKVTERRWKRVPRWIIAATMVLVIFLLLAAVQLLPTRELTALSNRRAGLTYEQATRISFPPENILTFFIPGLYGWHDMISFLDPQFVERNSNQAYRGRWIYWEVCAYAGVLPLLLAIIAVFSGGFEQRKFFAGLAILSLLLALGRYCFFYRLPYEFLPLFSTFRAPAKLLVLLGFGVSVLAGAGAHRVFAQVHGWRLSRRWRRAGMALLLVSAFLTGLFVFSPYAKGFWASRLESIAASGELYAPPPEPGDVALQENMQENIRRGAAIYLLLLVASLTVVTAAGRWPRKRLIAAFAMLLLVLDLGHFARRFVDVLPVGMTHFAPGVLGFLRSRPGPFRINTVTDSASLSKGMTDGILHIAAFNSLALKRYNEWVNFNEGRPLDTPVTVMSIRQYTRLLNMLNMKYLITAPENRLERESFPLVYEDKEVRVYENKRVLPRAYGVFEYEVVQGREAILNRLADPRLDSSRKVLLEREPLDSPPTAGATEEVLIQWLRDEPGRLELETSSRADALLVVADSHYPGWVARIDGEPTRIYVANYIQRAIVLPAGEHRVEFAFCSRSQRVGAMLSGVGLLLTGGLLLGLSIHERRKRRSALLGDSGKTEVHHQAKI